MTAKKVKKEPITNGIVNASEPVETNVVPSGTKVTVAIDKNGKYEIRRYTPVEHGEDFVKLAEGFATKKGYQLELA